MKRSLLCAACMAINAVSHAQFPVVGTVPANVHGLISLQDAGQKFLEFDDLSTSTDTIRILNLDLSLYREIILPPNLPGYSYGLPIYITEALFDNDPSTIEFISHERPNSGPGAFHVRVFREDGSLVFTTTGSVPYVGFGYYTTLTPPIFMTSVGATYMCVQEVNQLGTTIYQLPGQLPCVECDGGLVTGGGSDQFGSPGPAIGAFPNPSAGETTITYKMPLGETRGELVFFDSRGGEVRRLPVDGSGAVNVSLAQLPAATYFYQLETSQGIIGPKRLVVVR